MDLKVTKTNLVTGESHEETISYTEEDMQRIAASMIVEDSSDEGPVAYDRALTEKVRSWFFADQARLDMVSMVNAVPKMLGVKMSEEDEILHVISKLEKETAFEGLVPRGQMNKVDFESIAKCWVDGTVPPLR